MTNVALAIHPDLGLAEGYLCEPPGEETPLWMLSVSLGSRDPQTFSAGVVGAGGYSRLDAVVRGVGEAVERFALRPPPDGGPPAVPDDLLDLQPLLHRHGLLEPGRHLRPGLVGERLSDGARVAVPAQVVDYPVREGGVDSTPSGAASGLDLDGARLRAMVELVERDAFERAWQGVTTVRALELQAVEPGPGVRELRRAVQDRGYTVRLGLLETVVGIPAAVALLRRGDGPVGVGCSAGSSVAACAVKAVTEGIQVETLLHNWADERPRGPLSARPRTETQRLDRLCQASVWTDVWAFGDGFALAPPPELGPAPTNSTELAHRLAEHGVEVVSVDLTARLPEPVRDLGWVVVRVLPLGLQALRGDDSLPWTWCLSRMAHAAEDADAALRRLQHAVPHPLA